MHLVIYQGPDADRQIEFQKDSLILGRGPRCDTVLNDREVSRQHAKIYRDGDTIKICDLQSSNGTLVNGVAINTHELNHRDRIQIGRNLIVAIFDQPESGQVANEFVPERQLDVEIVGAPANANSIDESVSQIRKVYLPTKRTTAGAGSDSSLQRPSGEIAVEFSDQSASDIGTDPLWQMMYQAIVELSHLFDIKEISDRILDLIFTGIQCDRACILLYDQSAKRLLPASRKNRNANSVGSSMQISQTILDYVSQTGEGVLTSDAVHDQRWDTSASISRAGVREAICVPMSGRHGMIGVIYIDTAAAIGSMATNGEQELLTFDHLKLLTALGHHAALIIENMYNNQAMLQAERLATMGKVIATLSHHIKNILQGIEGGAYLVNEAMRNGELEAVQLGWKMVEKNQLRIKSLVLDMLAYGKERRPKLAEHDMNQIVAEVVELVAQKAREQHIEFVFQASDARASIYGEFDSLYHAILNLITNAIDSCIEFRKASQTDDYTPKISVIVSVDSSHVETIVIDNGEGLSETERASLFIAFESTKGGKGTGLGLAVSKKIVSEHGGSIRVESEPLKGSTFIVRLPMDNDRNPSRMSNEKTISL